MRSALPFVVLYDTEFILDTNAIDCYHKFDHRPVGGSHGGNLAWTGKNVWSSCVDFPLNRPFTGGFLMNGFFLWDRGAGSNNVMVALSFFERMLPFCRKKAGSLRFSVIDGLILRKIRA